MPIIHEPFDAPSLRLPHDPAVSGIIAYGILARQPTEIERDREARQSVRRMAPDELRLVVQAAGTLYREAERELGRRDAS